MNRTITVRLVASTAQFQAAMGAAAAQTKAIDRDLRTLAVNGDQSMRQLGKGMLVAGGLIAGGLAISVAKAMEFETQMRNVNSIAKLSEQQFAATSGEVLALSRKVPQSAATLAQGLYDIASSGFQGADAMKILESAAVSATAGMTTTDVAAKAITATLNAYGRNARDAGDISDVLFKTVEVGVITFEELASGMGDWIGMAAAAKVPVDEASAAIAAMTLSGVSAAESGTSLNRVLQQLISPNEELTEALRELGYESGAQALETDGLRGVMEKLRGATGGNIEQLQALFPEVRALRGVLALTANEGRNFGNTFEAVTDKARRAGAAQAAYAEQSKALSVQWDLAKSSATAFAIEVGNRMLPILTAVAREVAGVFDSFSSLPGPVITAGTALAGLSAVALLVGGSLLMLAPKIHAANLLLHSTHPAAASAARGLSMLWAVASGAGILLVAASSAQAASKTLDDFALKLRGVERADLDKLADSLAEFGKKGVVAGEMTKGFGANLDNIVRAVESTTDLTGWEKFLTAPKNSDIRAMEDYDKALTALVEAGRLKEAQAAFQRLTERLAEQGISVERAKEAFPGYTAAAGQAAAASEDVSAAAEEERRQIAELGKHLGEATTATEELSEAQKMIQERIDGVNKAIASFSDPISSYDAALEHNKAKAEEWADAQNTGIEKTKVSWEDYPGLVKEGLAGEALDANREKAREWAEATNESVDKSKVTWEDYPGGVIPSLKQVEEELDKNRLAYENWSSNLVILVQKGYGALAMELASKGPEYAQVVQQFVDAPDDELARIAPKFVDAQRRANEDTADELIKGALIQEEFARQGAQATVDTVASTLDLLPDEVRRIMDSMGLEINNARPNLARSWGGLSEDARREFKGVQRDVPPLARDAAEGANREVQNAQPTWGQSWADRYRTAHGHTSAVRRDVPPIVGATSNAMSDLLAGGLPRFQQTVGGYAGSLEGGIRTVAIAAAARAAANLRPFAEGGIVDFYANGGLKESHQAQIARAGDWRVWAEPETGGEAYIPLSPNKRGRSVPIWLETGRRLGLDEDSLDALRGVMAFHEGGLVDFPRRPDLASHGPPIRPRGEATMDNMLAFAREVAKEHMKLPHHQEPAMDMSIGGGAGAGMGWQWQMAVLRQRFPGLPLYSGLRPGAITATGNPSWHGKGRAVDIPPRLDVNKWIAQTFGAATKELILTAPGATQIKNGRPHVYTGITREMHKDHNHWAYKLGGILDGFTEQFNGLQSFDTGGFLRPGYTLAHNGTGQPEPVGLGDFSEATSQASRVGEEVLDALLSGIEFGASGVPQTFSEVGGGIAQGMAGGLRAGVPDVWAAMSMFSEAMPAKVKEQLGIESPSAVFHGYGHSVALGYANGIRAGIPAAQGAYADLMRASGMLQAEDGSWVPRSFYAKPRHIHPRPRHTHAAPPGTYGRPPGGWTPASKAAHFRHNNATDPNRGKPGYVQAEDGSWVGYTLAYNGTGRREAVIPTPMGPGASQSAPGPSVTIQASYAFTIDGELGPSSRRELHRMMNDNNRELARMVRAGTH